MSDSLNFFIEQAEYIETENFSHWTVEHPNETSILRKLTQSGQKLLIGPRGVGKTTLLLKAYHKNLKQSDKSDVFPVYVNFKSSLKLEPRYNKAADASYVFNQWVILKIILGIYTSLDALKSKHTLAIKREIAQFNVGQLEIGKLTGDDLFKSKLSVAALLEELETLITNLGYSRCILLLDDAAHAFSPEQQRDFFDLFRQLKSRHISSKAAIYPGVTTYPSTFHAGHDAEEINVWIDPNSERYTEFMLSLLEKRFSAQFATWKIKHEDLLKLICYASFGIPRVLINIIRSLIANEDLDEHELSFTKTNVITAIKNSFENTIDIYKSLDFKFPMYAKSIKSGEIIFQNMVLNAKYFNKSHKNPQIKSLIIAIKTPIPPSIQKTLSFFQYCALIYPLDSSNRGSKGVYDLYAVHYSALISKNAVTASQSSSLQEVIDVLENKNTRNFPRISVSTLIDGLDLESDFGLSIPPCHICDSERTPNAKFCLNCGTQLKPFSRFESIVSADIKVLPLTPTRINAIKRDSAIKIVRDILLDHDYQELLKVDRIGPFWAKKLKDYAEEAIS